MSLNYKVDILIPAYNCEKYISKCLESLLNQTYKNINIIIVDDSSTDCTLKIIKKYETQCKNIKVYIKQNEKNISKTRNFLLEKITCNYFTFFDADDYAEPTYIEELIKNLISYNADISICKKQRHKDHKNYKLKNKKLKTLYFFNKHEAIEEMISSNLYNGTVYCKIFKSELLKNIKFDETIHYGEDLDFCFNIMQNANKIIFSNQKLYHYINHKNSIVTSKFNPNKLSCLRSYYKIINDKNSTKTIISYAKSMQCLIAVELLFYIWRDRYKNAKIKQNLKKIIKNYQSFIKSNKKLPKILQISPAFLWLTNLM